MNKVAQSEQLPKVSSGDMLSVLPQQCTDPAQGWAMFSEENGQLAREVYRHAMEVSAGDMEVFGAIIQSHVFLYRSLQAALQRERQEEELQETIEINEDQDVIPSVTGILTNAA